MVDLTRGSATITITQNQTKKYKQKRVNSLKRST